MSQWYLGVKVSPRSSEKLPDSKLMNMILNYLGVGRSRHLGLYFGPGGEGIVGKGEGAK